MPYLKNKFKNILPITVIFMLAFGANIYAERRLVPCGVPIGVAIYNKGLIVTDISEVTLDDGSTVCPAKDAGIKRGDIITALNSKEISSADEILSAAETHKTLSLCINRGGQIFQTEITPQKTSEGVRLGIWVRDSTAGIGTLSYYEPNTNRFYALGHGISYEDSGQIMDIRTGNIYLCKITGAERGTKGHAGELNGEIISSAIGTIDKNTDSGICGTLTDKIHENPIALPVCDINEVSEGYAEILSDVDGNGTCTYAISIEKVDKKTTSGKNFVIKITDDKLIEKTGGIVQGMSGSPIIQDGKLVGAVTHVFVNDPTRGYGIFIENMLDEAMKVN